MGTTSSKLPGRGSGEAPAQPQHAAIDSTAATCPLGFDKKTSTKVEGADSGPPANSGGTISEAPAASCPVKTLLPGSGAGSAAPAAPSGDAPSSSCPVKEENRSKVAKYLHPHKYNVYSQRIDGKDGGLDPTNNMPVNPNQRPAPGQENPLSTARVPSTIPKGGEETTWTYPSPQMFW